MLRRDYASCGSWRAHNDVGHPGIDFRATLLASPESCRHATIVTLPDGRARGDDHHGTHPRSARNDNPQAHMRQSSPLNLKMLAINAIHLAVNSTPIRLEGSGAP